MKRTTKSNVDGAVFNLIFQGADKYHFYQKSIHDIPDSHVNEVFELTLDIVNGDEQRHKMMTLSKSNKLTIIKQIIVSFILPRITKELWMSIHRSGQLYT